MKFLNLWIRRYSTKKLEKILLSMPKDTTEHIQANQRHRLRIREKSKFYSPGTVNIQVLGSGARGTSSSVYIFSEQSRYLFNCGEGTQRLAHEHRTKLTRMEHIFLTRKAWNQFGGVPGLCLTLQEIGVPKIHLHGPAGISEIFDSTRRFVVLKNMAVETPDCADGGVFEDSVMRVNYVPLYRDVVETSSSSEDVTKETNDNDWSNQDKTDYFGYEEANKLVQQSLERENTKKRASSKKEDHVMAYICKLQPRPGTLNLEKCVEKGVKPGPLLGHLKNGVDVKLPDGTIVKADDVRGPSCPGVVYIFIDIPDETYLNALLNCERFKPHQSECTIEHDRAFVIVHFSPEEMTSNVRYKEWMDRFWPSTAHIFVNERNSFTGYFASHRIQRQLHELDRNVFPMLKERHPYMLQPSEMAVDVTEINEENPAKIFKIDAEGENSHEDKFSVFPEVGVRTTFHLRPPNGFDRNKEPYNHPETVMEETYVNSPDLPKLITEFRSKAQNLIVSRTVAERNNEFPRVILFGTGSMIPNKTRNVSSNLVHFSPDECAILDCGEGTLGQIIRFYGRDGADEILKKLKMIYISHLHADHHLGLLNILTRRRKLTKDKILVVAPHQINSWLSFYNYRIGEILSTFELVPCSEFIGWPVDESKPAELIKRIGLLNLQICYVKHCPHSFGIAMTMKNLMKSERNPNETVKITYSGDTMPCEALIEIGKNSDILIHEATMEDDLWKEARIKMHSTVSEAVSVGQQMKARFTILTHFSQRYAKIPLLANNLENVTIGFDNMEVTLHDLPMMHLMYDPLKSMFADHYELMEQKNQRRKFLEDKKIVVNLPSGNGKNKKRKFDSDDEF